MKKVGIIIIGYLLTIVSVFSQSDEVIHFIDNNKYWKKMASQGKATLNQEQPVPPVTFGSSFIKSAVALGANSLDVELTGLTEGTQSENSVFVNPNEMNVLNSNNTYTSTIEEGVSSIISSDQGKSWDASLTVGSSSFCDPAVVIGNNGRMFINYINENDGQSISYSDNNGASWTDVVVAQTQSSGMLDKNHLWIDNSQRSNYEGNLYCAWMQTGSTNQYEIEISRGTNNGTTWSVPTAISRNTSGYVHQGVDICTGPEGQVYAVWAIYPYVSDVRDFRETSLGFASSTNGGQSFSSSKKIIDDIYGIRAAFYNENPTGKQMRVNSFPSMTVDISGGAHDGNIYVVWSNVGMPGTNTGDDVDVYLIRSEDEGATWSNPIRVNQDAAGQGASHYFPAITCDPVTGDLAIVFYDDRNVGGEQVEVFCAVSQDGGDSWSDFKVSDIAFTPVPIPGLASGYMGDYLSISSHNGIVYPVWTDNRSGRALTYCSPFIVGGGCLDDLVLQDDIIEINRSETYSAINTITVAGNNSSYVVDGNGTDGGTLVLKAGQELYFKKGFHVEKGGGFSAALGSCIDPGSSTKNTKDLIEIQDDSNNVGIDTKSDMNMKIYPNPNNGLFSIDINSGNSTDGNDYYIVLTDLMGKSYLTHEIGSQNTFSVDVSDINPGVYIVHLYSNDNLLETQRILVK